MEFSPQPRFDIVFLDFRSCVEIVRVDLETGMSDLILIAECPGGSWDSASPWPKVCGDIVAVRLSQLRPPDTFHTHLYLVLDWRAQLYCTIVCSPVSNFLLFFR